MTITMFQHQKLLKRLNNKWNCCSLTDSRAEILTQALLTLYTCFNTIYLYITARPSYYHTNRQCDIRWYTVHIEIQQRTFTFCQSVPSGSMVHLPIAVMMHVISELQLLEVTSCKWKHRSYEIIICQSWYYGLSVVLSCVNTDWQAALRSAWGNMKGNCHFSVLKIKNCLVSSVLMCHSMILFSLPSSFSLSLWIYQLFYK